MINNQQREKKKLEKIKRKRKAMENKEGKEKMLIKEIVQTMME